jgi:osmoprotectant transport system permease protein
VRLLAVEDPWLKWSWIGDHLDDIAAALRQHVGFTVVAVVVGFAISLPLAVAAQRWRWLRPPALGLAGLLYTIPSLAAFALLVPWTGLSRVTALIPLVAYTLFILVRSILTGLDGVPPATKDAADGMGYRRFARLVRVELPLALPSISAGLRLATVTTVGLVTVTALLGFGGLGSLIYDGFGRDFRTPITVGTVLCVVLAVVLDLAIVGVTRLMTPWTRARAGR